MLAGEGAVVEKNKAAEFAFANEGRYHPAPPTGRTLERSLRRPRADEICVRLGRGQTSGQSREGSFLSPTGPSGPGVQIWFFE